MNKHTTKAFTLAEVMIALSILGIGLTMTAALLPTAINENKNSSNNTVGTVICENGLAIVKARCTYPLTGSSGKINNTTWQLVDLKLPAASKYEYLYPIPPDPSVNTYPDPNDPMHKPIYNTVGWAAVAVSKAADAANGGVNDYSMLIVAYRLQSQLNTFSLITKDTTPPINCNCDSLGSLPGVPTTTSYISGHTGDINNVQVGAPVFFPDGSYAIAVSKYDSSTPAWILDRKVPAGNSTVSGVLVETSGGTVVAGATPIMFVMPTRLGFRLTGS